MIFYFIERPISNYLQFVNFLFDVKIRFSLSKEYLSLLYKIIT